MIARVKDNQYIYLDNLTTIEEDLVIKRFSARQQKYQYVAADQRGSWDGVYCRYDKKHHRLARPFLAELRQLCNDVGLALVVQDERKPWAYQPLPPEAITPDFLPGITLHPHQIAAIKAGVVTEVGLIEGKTGSGKTEVMAGLVKAITCPTVILADQRIIVEQIKARLELRQVVDDVGLFYAGKTPTGQLVVVGTVQSLVVPKEPKIPDEQEMRRRATERIRTKMPNVLESDLRAAVDKWAKKNFPKALARYDIAMKAYQKRRTRARQFRQLIEAAEMLLVDECDLAVSTIYKTVFRFIYKGRRRYGFSGTMFDESKPVQNLFLQEHLGSIIATVEKEELEKIGQIIPIHYYTLALGDFRNRQEGSTYDIAVQEHIVNGTDLHQTIASVCRAYPDDGTLILVDRDQLGYNLASLIPGSEFIHGKTPKRRCDDVLRAFERRDQRVVIGGKIIKRGLDLRGGCENLVIATGGTLSSGFLQQLGRGVRRNKLGYCRVFDFYFFKNRYLYGHSRKRLKVIVGLGYESRVIFKHGKLDGAKLVASRFLLPRWAMQP